MQSKQILLGCKPLYAVQDREGGREWYGGKLRSGDGRANQVMAEQIIPPPPPSWFLLMLVLEQQQAGEPEPHYSRRYPLHMRQKRVVVTNGMG